MKSLSQFDLKLSILIKKSNKFVKMMRSTTNKAAFGNNVQADRQWIRRVKQEEYNMIDSYSGPTKQKIDQARTAQTKNHFYP